MPEPLIDPNRVNEIFAACEVTDEDARYVSVEGIGAVSFDPDRLAENHDEIVAMLDGLSTDFKRSGGGGMSFLNACMDANGEQWTGFHQTQERLFLLGMGIDRVSLLLPRDMWVALPGGMPYYIVEDVARAS